MERKNVIIIVLDAFRRDLLDIFSDRKQSITPNLTRLAKKSLVFSDCYCNGFATDSNLTTISTGLLPWQHGILNQGTSMTQSVKEMINKRKDFFLQNILREEGYTNCAIDILERWHKIGYNNYIDPLKITRSMPNKLSEYLWGGFPYKLLKILGVQPAGKYNAEDVAKISERIMPNMDSPFFLFLHFWDTHAPYISPPGYETQIPKTMYNEKTKKIISRIRNRGFKEYIGAFAGDTTHTDEVVGRYHACAKYLDRQIGQLINFLRENSILENSILVITSDHGECLGEKNAFFSHHTHHQAQLRVPLLIYHPNLEGREIRVRTQHVDILPTLLDLLDLEGMNRSKFAGESKLNRKKDSIIYFGLTGNRTGLGERVGVILDEYKYSQLKSNGRFSVCKKCGVRHHRPEELYNIKKDPEEKRNLVDNNPKLKKYLGKLIEGKNLGKM